MGVWLPAGIKEKKTSWASFLFYLFQPPPLLLLLLNPFLSLRQQLPFILLLLPELLLLQELLSPKGLGALLVLLLQSQEIPAKGGLAGHIDDGAVGGSGAVRGMLWVAWQPHVLHHFHIQSLNESLPLEIQLRNPWKQLYLHPIVFVFFHLFHNYLKLPGHLLDKTSPSEDSHINSDAKMITETFLFYSQSLSEPHFLSEKAMSHSGSARTERAA